MNPLRLRRVQNHYRVNRCVYTITVHRLTLSSLPSAQGKSGQRFNLSPLLWRRFAANRIGDGPPLAQLFALKPLTPATYHWAVTAHAAGAAVAHHNIRKEVRPPIGHTKPPQHRYASGSARYTLRGIKSYRTCESIVRPHGSAQARCIQRSHVAPGEQCRLERVAKPRPYPYERFGFWLKVNAGHSSEHGMYCGGVIDVVSQCIISYHICSKGPTRKRRAYREVLPRGRS